MAHDVKVTYQPLGSANLYEANFAFPPTRLFIKRAVDVGKRRVCQGKRGFKGEIGEVDACLNGTFVPREAWDETEVFPGALIELREMPPTDAKVETHLLD